MKRNYGPLVFILSLFYLSSLHAVTERTLNNGNLVLQDIPQIPEKIISDLNRYQNVRSASFYGFMPDSESILIGTRFADVSQIHRVDYAGGARHQLTFFDEPIGQVRVQPGGTLVAFTMDAGGSEFAQIFLLDLQSGDYQMISDGKSRNGALLWSNDGTQLAYQSTQRNGRSNDIWLASIDKEGNIDHKLILESEDGSWWGPSSFSANANKLLVLQYISSTKSLVHLVDTATSETTMLAGGGDKQSRNFAQSFDSDEQYVYLLTDRYSNFMQLVKQNLKSGEETIITKSLDWDVTNVTFNHDKSMGVLVTNENGLSKLYLYNPKQQTYTPVDNLPTGVIGSLEFNQDSSKLAMALNTPSTPTDVFVLDIADNDLNRWTYSEVGGLNTNEFIEPELIHYETFDTADGKSRKIPAFVYRPNTDGPHPVIISIHGGPEGQARPVFSSTYQLWLKQLGAAVVVPNVRGSAGYGKEYLKLDNGFKREDSVKDIGALLDWVATQEDLDSDRVAVFGGSYGGYMVLASSMYYSDRLKAAVNIVGISNFVTFLTNTKSYRRDLRRVEYGDERDPDMRAFLERISPTNNVEKIKVPMFVVQGENDPRVPVTEAIQIVDKLREAGQTVWYMNALNEGHGYRKKENRDVYQQATVLFFEQHLLE